MTAVRFLESCGTMMNEVQFNRFPAVVIPAQGNDYILPVSVSGYSSVYRLDFERFCRPLSIAAYR